MTLISSKNIAVINFFIAFLLGVAGIYYLIYFLSEKYFPIIFFTNVFRYYLNSLYVTYNFIQFLFFTLSYLLLFLITFVMYFENKTFLQSYYETHLAIFLFPFYMFFKALSLVVKDNKYEKIVFKDKIYEQKKVKNINVSDFAPILILSKYGDTTQRKSSVRVILSMIKEGKSNIESGLELLKSMLSDEHPDVVIYASDALTELEDFFIKKIDETKNEIFNNPKDLIEHFNYVKYYIMSGLLSEDMKKQLIEESVRIIDKNTGKFGTRYDIISIYSDFLELKGENPLEILISAYEKYPVTELLEKIILQSFKYRDYDKLKKYTSEFYEKNYDTDNEALRYLLELGDKNVKENN